MTGSSGTWRSTASGRARLPRKLLVDRLMAPAQGRRSAYLERPAGRLEGADRRAGGRPRSDGAAQAGAHLRRPEPRGVRRRRRPPPLEARVTRRPTPAPASPLASGVGTEAAAAHGRDARSRRRRRSRRRTRPRSDLFSAHPIAARAEADPSSLLETPAPLPHMHPGMPGRTARTARTASVARGPRAHIGPSKAAPRPVRRCASTPTCWTC